MNGPTHMVGAAAAGATVTVATGGGVSELAAIVIGALAADRIPDQDRRFDKSANHRSITHSLVLAGGASVACAIFIGIFASSVSIDAELRATLAAFGVGLPAGYLAHLALDSLTPKRVWLLLPGGPRFGPGLMEGGGLGEGLLFLVLCGAGGAALMSVLGGV